MQVFIYIRRVRQAERHTIAVRSDYQFRTAIIIWFHNQRRHFPVVALIRNRVRRGPAKSRAEKIILKKQQRAHHVILRPDFLPDVPVKCCLSNIGL